MVTQPSIAQGIKFNLQHLDLYPEPGNNRVQDTVQAGFIKMLKQCVSDSCANN